MALEGDVEAGFEPVTRAFEDERDQLGRGGGALCVYVDGRPVIDVWTGVAREGRPWRRDTAVCLMSATKGLAGLCALVLHDRGLLDIDAPVATYWPEFAVQGKAEITVRQLLSNRAGLPAIPDYHDLFGRSDRIEGFDVAGFAEHEEIQRRLAAATPIVPPGTPAYGIVTFGYLVGALVQRVSGRPLATFFHEEVAGPLGLELWLGSAAVGPAAVAAETLPPDPLPPDLPKEVVDMLTAWSVGASDPATVEGRAWLAGTGVSLFDPDNYIGAMVATTDVVTSGGGFGEGLGTARGLARLYGMLSCDGTLDGERYVSDSAVATFSAVETTEVDAVIGTVIPWTIGFHGNMSRDADAEGEAPSKQYGPSDRAFGKDGLGGQVAFADPENRVAVGLVRNHHAIVPDYRFSPTMGPGISRLVIDALYETLGVGR